ncbi:DUF1622 domain-containing protein [Plantactinospora sp. WMMB334]|uniref:DUF1622 domain-containing protein n=1 Tax=Plantactinospora sp. WMMB334 TaxID=3404119 RepID=UPI003B925BF9
MSSKEIIERVGTLLDLAGVLVIAGGVVVATGYFLYRYWRTRQLVELYRPYRRTVGRAILLGLEIIVGGDIIRTVAVSPTFESVGVLAVIVLVRTFLSLSLEVELEGRWPWRSRRTRSAPAGSDQPG